METTARRYRTPATPPVLIRHAAASPKAPAHPLLCLRCGGATGHAAPRLVSFDWGRVAPSVSRR